ncbi:TetR/AcrR family transcriptional regulator [Streptomyces sp. NPDC093225]|uniref:TetR/AcrR family transcriptional regulator n=1 Tax=Streptomyces sp. NPDC093225 TaxID=3366034 RepID=UPI0038206004
MAPTPPARGFPNKIQKPAAEASAAAGSRPGGRSARVRAQVLEAAGLQLVEHGYDALTVDAVAERAGVHRTTVYRRWRDVGGLLADLLDSAADDAWRPADTGSLEGDLTAMNQEILEAVVAEPSLTTALVAASFRSAEAARALRAFWAGRYERSAEVVERAGARGEVPPGTVPRPLLVAATAPLFHELVLLGTDPDPALPARAARAAALAARAGAFTGPPPGGVDPR